MDTNDRVVLITGASSGIGRATAQHFHARGWRVIATMKDMSANHQLTSDERMDILTLDVTHGAGIEEVVRAVIEKYGRIDVLVNNAGYGLLGPVEYIDHAQIERQFAVNVVGLMDMTRAVIPHMRAQGRGTIVNISSMMGRISFPFFAPYVASKWAVEGYTETIRMELEPFGIRAKLVEPATIKTRFFYDAEHVALSAEPYASRWSAVWNNVTQRGKLGADPELAARVIYRAATDGSGRLRYPVDTLSYLLPFLRATNPLWLFQNILQATVR